MFICFGRGVEVPALPTADFVTTAKPKRNIKAKVFKDCETTNIIERRLIKNSKGLKVPDCITEQTKHSFFVETIVHWNQLPDKVVCADSVEAFKTALQEYSPQNRRSLLPCIKAFLGFYTYQKQKSGLFRSPNFVYKASLLSFIIVLN